MPLVYVFAASKMEAQPVLVWAAGNDASSQSSAVAIIEHGDDRFALIITCMGMRNAEARADAALGLVAPGPDDGPPLAGKPDAVLVLAGEEHLQPLPCCRNQAVRVCIFEGRAHPADVDQSLDGEAFLTQAFSNHEPATGWLAPGG